MEIWKAIPDYEGKYEVSNKGNVRSLNYHKQKRICNLKQQNKKDGYLEVTLVKNGKANHIRTHRLVAMVFCDNPHNKKEVNHIDGNKHNNRADNLEWVTSSENQKHAYRIGLHKAGGCSISNHNHHFIEYNGKRQTLTAWAEELNIPRIRLTMRLKRGWSIERALTEPRIKPHGRIKNNGN